MAQVHEPDGWPIVPFATPDLFEAWLDTEHERSAGLWVKFAKKGRGIASLTLPQAVEVAGCFGWVDSRMYRVDDDYYILKFQPRRPKSNWSTGSRSLAERLIAEGRMRPAGQSAVDAARRDGRWSD